MLEIKKRYVVDERNERVAVQLDLETFERIEALIEDRGLGELIQEVEGDDVLDLDEARAYYASLPKAPWTPATAASS